MAGSLKVNPPQKQKESNTNELCDDLKFLLQENQAGNNSKVINEEIVAKADQLLECKCIYTKQHSSLVEMLNGS